MLIYTLVLAFICRIADARRNISLDDSDLAIVYTGDWLRTPYDPLNRGGDHMVTANTDAYATLTFTGVAIYFYSPLWPFRVTTALALDGIQSGLLDLRDYNVPYFQDGSETALSEIVWYTDGLENTTHVLNISVGDGEDLAILDYLVYTVVENGDASSNPSLVSMTHTRSLSITTSPSSTAVPSQASPSTKTGLSITLSLVCVIFGSLVLWALIWYWRRRRRRLAEEAESLRYALPSNRPSMSETSRRPIYPRTTGLSSINNPVDATTRTGNNTNHRRSSSGSQRSNHNRTHSRSAAAFGFRRHKKPLSTIPELSGDYLGEGYSEGSSMTATPESSPDSPTVRLVKPDSSMNS